MAKKAVNLSPSEMLLAIGEELKRQAVRPNINGYVPHDKQVVFHSSPAKTRLYIGGNRSGKSFGNVAECVYWLTKNHPYRKIPVGDYEGTRGRINAVDFPHGVDKILLPLFKQLLPPSILINGSWEDSYSKSDRVLTLNNGSFLEFLSYEQDLDKFAGTSRHFVAYDEEPPETIYTENRARLIDTQGHQWFSMTPVEGISWVYDAIYLPGKAGKASVHITEISMDENPYLSKEAIEEFLGDLDEDERLAREKGQFVEIGGRIYKKFDSTIGGIHVIDKVALRFPPNVPIGVSLDHGFNNPTALLWHALLPEGRVITFHERYLSGEVVRSHARYLHEFNKVNRIQPTIYVADPSIRNTDPITGTSIQQEYLKYGVPFSLGNNDVKAGIERVASYLNPRAGGIPMWQVTRDCPNTIREMGRYKWSTYQSRKLDNRYNKKEEPHKKDDHCPDSLRYFLMSRPELEKEYANANQRTRVVEFYDDSVVQPSGDWSVREIRGMEYEYLSAHSGEYTDRSGLDQMGGIW